MMYRQTFLAFSVCLLALGNMTANAQTYPKAATVKGIVEKMVVSKGTRSEKEVMVVITSRNETIQLRARNANPFVISPELSKLEGLEVSCSGHLISKTQLVNASCEEI